VNAKFYGSCGHGGRLVLDVDECHPDLNDEITFDELPEDEISDDKADETLIIVDIQDT
jgi:hypothetical protein